MKSNEKIIEEYEEFRKKVEIVKERTWEIDYFTLKKLNEYVKGKSFKELKEMEIANYLNRYSRRGKVNRITLLTHFYRWLYNLDKDERLPDCIRNINRNRESLMKIYKDEAINYRERIVTEEEYQRLIDCSYRLMHKAMIETLYNFGCRASELLSMNGNDVIYNGNVTKITVRNSKTQPREIIYDGRSKYLLKWYESYAPFKDKKNKPLWTNYQERYKNDRYTISGLDKSIRVISKRAELRPITPHDFRHTWISNKRREGTPDTHIVNNAGLEKDTRMMKVYDHNNIDDYEKWIKERSKNIKPTYEQLEKKYKDKEEKQEKEIKDLKKRLNLIESVIKNSVYKDDLEEDIEYEKDRISNKKLLKMLQEGDKEKIVKYLKEDIKNQNDK